MRLSVMRSGIGSLAREPVELKGIASSSGAQGWRRPISLLNRKATGEFPNSGHFGHCKLRKETLDCAEISIKGDN